MASSQKDASPNMGKKSNGKEIKEGPKSAGKAAFNDKSVGVEPNEGAPKLSGKGVIGKCI